MKETRRVISGKAGYGAFITKRAIQPQINADERKTGWPRKSAEGARKKAGGEGGIGGLVDEGMKGWGAVICCQWFVVRGPWSVVRRRWIVAFAQLSIIRPLRRLDICAPIPAQDGLLRSYPAARPQLPALLPPSIHRPFIHHPAHAGPIVSGPVRHFVALIFFTRENRVEQKIAKIAKSDGPSQIVKRQSPIKNRVSIIH